VLVWLRLNLQRVQALGAMEHTFTANLKVDDLILKCSQLDKIDKFVLPLPYCQLLKVFLLFYVFSAPFELAPDLGLFWNPIISALAAVAFYGLDQLGAELEQPFGTEDNNLPILQVFFKGLRAVLKERVGEVN
jgi:putative membrane protein